MHEYETKLRRKEKERVGGDASSAAPMQPQNPYGGAPPPPGYSQVHVQVSAPGQVQGHPPSVPHMGGYVAPGTHMGRGTHVQGGMTTSVPPPPPHPGSAGYGGGVQQQPIQGQGRGYSWRGNGNKQQHPANGGGGGQKRSRGGY